MNPKEIIDKWAFTEDELESFFNAFCKNASRQETFDFFAFLAGEDVEPPAAFLKGLRRAGEILSRIVEDGINEGLRRIEEGSIKKIIIPTYSDDMTFFELNHGLYPISRRAFNCAVNQVVETLKEKTGLPVRKVNVNLPDYVSWLKENNIENSNTSLSRWAAEQTKNDGLHPAMSMLCNAPKQITRIMKIVDKEYMSIKSQHTGPWPEVCYLPILVSMIFLFEEEDNYDSVTQSKWLALASLGEKLSMYSAWRLGKGIYRFDPDIYQAIVESKDTNILEASLLSRLPEYCIFVEMIGNEFFLGFWAFLDPPGENSDHDMELRIVFLKKDMSILSIPVHMKRGMTIESSLREASMLSMKTFFNLFGEKFHDEESLSIAKKLDSGEPLSRHEEDFLDDFLEQFGFERYAESTREAVSLVMYICSENADFGRDEKPKPAKPRKVKKGYRFFQANTETVYEMGVRTGSAIRRIIAGRHKNKEPGGERTVIPHLRRAHWHSFWTGPRNQPEKRKKVVRWIPPVLVNADGIAEAPGVVHHIDNKVH